MQKEKKIDFPSSIFGKIKALTVSLKQTRRNPKLNDAVTKAALEGLRSKIIHLRQSLNVMKISVPKVTFAKLEDMEKTLNLTLSTEKMKSSQISDVMYELLFYPPGPYSDLGQLHT